MTNSANMVLKMTLKIGKLPNLLVDGFAGGLMYVLLSI